MPAYLRRAALLGLLALFTPAAEGQQYIAPALKRPVGNAPDMMGPGFYLVTPDGVVSGPHYYVRPWWCPETGYQPGPYTGTSKAKPAPVQGVAPPPFGPPQQQGLPTVNSFPSHPFARSPRDFFMFHENLEAERSRDLRPSIVP